MKTYHNRRSSNILNNVFSGKLQCPQNIMNTTMSKVTHIYFTTTTRSPTFSKFRSVVSHVQDICSQVKMPIILPFGRTVLGNMIEKEPKEESSILKLSLL